MAGALVDALEKLETAHGLTKNIQLRVCHFLGRVTLIVADYFYPDRLCRAQHLQTPDDDALKWVANSIETVRGGVFMAGICNDAVSGHQRRRHRVALDFKDAKSCRGCTELVGYEGSWKRPTFVD